MKTLWLNPNLHIEFDLPLRAALIFPLSHTVQCALLTHRWKLVCLISSAKFTTGKEGGRMGMRRSAWGGIWGIYGLMRVCKWACSFDVLHVARMTANGSMATVWVFFFLSGNQSVQRRWAPGEPTRHVARCSLSWGRDGESSDLALTFPGHHRGMGEEEETFSAKWKEGKRGVNHPSKVDLKLKHRQALQS